jgi:ribosome-associated translation inhibitor RaiA/DNA-directed RNA polymerase specialized sigma24 family protein
MKHEIEFKDFEASEITRKHIEELIKRLEKRMGKFSPDEVFLRLKVEENSAHKLYTAVLALDLPAKIMAAREQTRQPELAIGSVFDEIERQLADYKASIRGERLWKRLAGRKELRQTNSGAHPLGPQDPESFFALVNPHLKAVDDFVSHEISYAEATGDLTPAELTAEDIVDAALLRAHQEFIENPARGDVRSWLMKLAIEQLDSEIKRSTSERASTIHIEENVPETPPAEEVSTLGDEILDFYQPDEKLKVEDIIPAPSTK